jgi:general stress protein 26
MAGNTEPEKSETEKREMLGQIINDASAAFLVTRSAGDGLRGRPMATAKVEGDLSALWFACQKDSHVAAEVRADARVYLGYTNHTGSEWASINGLATVVTDRATIRALWNPIWKNWFDGPDDPKITLIRVDPQDAEYWDSGSRAVMLLKLAFAAVTGAKVADGEHERVDVGMKFSEDQHRVKAV